MDRGHWANLARMPGLHPYSFKRHPGIFCDHRQSGPRFNVSSEGRCSFDSIVSPSLYWGIRTHTDHRVSTPCWPHEHLFLQKPVFSQKVSHPGTNQAQPCLALMGNQSWATG